MLQPGRLVSEYTISGAEFLAVTESLLNYTNRDFLQSANIFVRLTDLKSLVAIQYPIPTGVETKIDIFENAIIANYTFEIDQLQSTFNRIDGADMMHALNVFDLFCRNGRKIDSIDYFIDVVRFKNYLSVIFRHKNNPPGGYGGEGFWASISYQDGSVIRSALSR
jgi:hypothetical protein